MEYDELYDESPYTSREALRRGGIMNIIRATFLICATILASVFAIIFYGYQQDQYVINSNGNFVSIFDRKSKTLNVCDKGNCNLITPTFESHPVMTQGFAPQGSLAPQVMNPQQGMPGQQPGSRILGSFPQQQGIQGNPQMMGQPQMINGNSQMMQQRGMMPQQGNPQMMGQMNPQMMQQRGMMPQQGNPQMMGQANSQMMGQMTPQMMQQMQQRGMMPQQANPQMMSPQMIRGTPQAAQAQMTGGIPQANQTPAADDANTDDTNADDTNADATTSDEGEEEAAPV